MSLYAKVKKSQYNHKGYIADLPESLIGSEVRVTWVNKEVYYDPTGSSEYATSREATMYESLAVMVDGAVKDVIMNETSDPALLKLGMEELQKRLKIHDEAVKKAAQEIVDNPMYADERLGTLKEKIEQQKVLEQSVDRIQDVLDNLDKRRNYKKRLRGEPAALEVTSSE